MKNNIRWIYFPSGIILSVLLIFLIIQTQSINSPKENQIAQNLMTLQKLNSDWDADVLRAKTGEAAHYDPLTMTANSIRRIIGELKKEIKTQEDDIGANAEGKKIEIDAFEKTFNEKLLKIERFKSQNAILRNSTQFLHTGTSNLSTQIQRSQISEKQQIALERILNRVYAGVMTYIQNADPHREDQILRDLQSLDQLSHSLNPDLAEETSALVIHVRQILRQQVDGIKLHDEIHAIDTSKSIAQMMDINTSINSDRIKSLEFLQKVLMFFSGGLVLVLCFMIYKSIFHYQELKSTSEKLEEAYAKLKESQVHQVQTEKMSALGQMVAGIAHEINTPLAYLKATFNIIQEQLPPLEHVVDDSRALAVALRSKSGLEDLHLQITKVEEGSQAAIRGGLFSELGTLTQDGIHGVDQISEIVTNLKNFSRLDREKVTGFSVESGLDSTLLLARNLIKYTVTVVKDYGHVPSVLGAPSQINQVFLNLITNASHAMPQRPVEDNIIQLRTRWLRETGMVLIEIEDNGKGIEPEHLPKIFDPFFTTKPIGQGTGMGLSISYKIIKEHGGRLEVNSQVGKGTTFSILLPIERHNLADTLDPEQSSSSHQALVD